MKCLAVDDEPLALQIIEDYIEKIDFITNEGLCTNAVEATALIQEKQIDLVFLDIQMPNLTGIEFLRSLSKPPMVIFTTAYNQYALEGFELDAIDYLLKPFSFTRFMQAVNKAYELYQLRQKASGDNEFVSVSNDFLLVKIDYQTVKVDFKDILFIESMADYIRIITNEKKFTALATLKSVQEMLPSPQFIRIHRSYIISLAKIKSFNKKTIHIEDYDIPLGDSYKEQFEVTIRSKTIG